MVELRPVKAAVLGSNPRVGAIFYASVAKRLCTKLSIGSLTWKLVSEQLPNSAKGNMFKTCEITPS